MHDGHNGLILTSKRSSLNSFGQEGVYLTFVKITFRTPFTEVFRVTGNETLAASHTMKFLD